MINSIQIKNYRGIKDMKIDNFKKYNIFTGDNGSCKTTVIEALAISCTSVASLIKVARERDFKLTQNNISSFFYNTKISENINILINDRYETEINIKKIVKIFLMKSILIVKKSFYMNIFKKIMER